MFSVLLPVYYKEKASYLSAALQSIINQTLIPSELVLVKDGPLTEELEFVIDNFKQGNLIDFKMVLLEENVGLGLALQQGVLACKNSIIARMDSDDIALPNRFHFQFEFLCENKDYDIVGSCIDEFCFNPEKIEQTRFVPKTHEKIAKGMRWKNNMNHMTVMFRKKAVLEAGNYKNFINFEDYNLWIRMIQNNSKFYNLNQSLVAVRLGENFLKRRSGIEYFKSEYRFFLWVEKSGFINKCELFFILCCRFTIRILPLFITNRFYSTFLRKHPSETRVAKKSIGFNPFK